MSDIHEAVVLPDPTVKRLLHPTDLPEVRSLYLRGWWFGRACSLPIVVAHRGGRLDADHRAMVAIAGRRHPVALAERLVTLAAVAVSAVVVATVGLDGQWNSEHSTSAILGAATILLAQSPWGIATVARNRRERSR